MLTGQEAEISILEEELEKMAVLAGECSARSQLAEERLQIKEIECSDLEGNRPIRTRYLGHVTANHMTANQVSHDCQSGISISRFGRFVILIN